MTASPLDRSSLDALLAHRAWVRGLARRLARDDFAADDLAQDAWLAAMRRPPQDDGRVRRWFVRVMRNRAREVHRASHRAEARERLGARPEGTPSAADLVADADAHRRVVEAVLALPEPHRETVLLRFYEGLAPREIAARVDVPVETVRTRLKRAAHLLRAALGGGEGSGAAWLAAVAPLVAGGEGRRPNPVAEGLAMKLSAKSAIALVLLLFLGVGTALTRPWDTAQGAADGDSAGDAVAWAAPAKARPAASSTRTRRRTGASALVEQTATDSAAATTATPQSSSPGAARTSGRVLLPDGAPAAGAAVCLGASSWVAADAEGRFVVTDRRPGQTLPVWVLLPGYRAPPISPVTVAADGSIVLPDVKLVEDTFVRVRGVVRSSKGPPVAAARVRLQWNARYEEMAAARSARDPSVGLMLVVTGAWTKGQKPAAVVGFRDLGAVTDADGSFGFDVPALVGVAGLVATADGFAENGVFATRLADTAATPLEITLRPKFRVRGRVVDAVTRVPAAGSRVSPGTKQGQGGVEELLNAQPTDPEGRFDLECERWVYGHAPGYLVGQAEAREDGGDVTIALRRAFSVTGRVLFADGRAIAGALVSTGVCDGATRTGDFFTYSKSDGVFEIAGLPDGEYTLSAAPQEQSPSFHAKSVEHVGAGATAVSIVVDAALSISGVVVGESGAPLERMYVCAGRPDITASAWTDEEGRFEIVGLAAGMHPLRAIDPEGRAGGHLPAEIEAVAAGTSGLRIVVGKGASIAGVLVDEDGRALVGQRVMALDAKSNPLDPRTGGPAAVSDSEGRFAVSGLAPGTYRLQVDGGYSKWPRTWLRGGESVAADSAGVRVVLTEGGVIAGTLVDVAGSSIAGKRVSAFLSGDDAFPKSATTDEQGRFEIRNLPQWLVYAVTSPHGRVDGVKPGTRNLVLAPR